MSLIATVEKPASPNQIASCLIKEADRNGLLTSYRDDLNVHDRALLEQMEGWPQFIWIAGESYSYLYPVGLHSKAHESVLDVLSTRSSVPYIGLVDGINGTVRRIDKTKATHLAAPGAKCWKREGHTLCDTSGKRLGQLLIGYTYQPLRGSHLCSYDFKPLSTNTPVPMGFVAQWVINQAQADVGLWVSVVLDNA